MNAQETSEIREPSEIRELTIAELDEVTGGGSSVANALDGIFKAASVAAQKVG